MKNVLDSKCPILSLDFLINNLESIPLRLVMWIPCVNNYFSNTEDSPGGLLYSLVVCLSVSLSPSLAITQSKVYFTFAIFLSLSVIFTYYEKYFTKAKCKIQLLLPWTDALKTSNTGNTNQKEVILLCINKRNIPIFPFFKIY